MGNQLTQKKKARDDRDDRQETVDDEKHSETPAREDAGQWWTDQASYPFGRDHFDHLAAVLALLGDIGNHRQADLRHFLTDEDDSRGLKRAIELDKKPAMVIRYNHARELRTIGQQLDRQNIDIFELRYDGGEYVLDCADPNPPFTDLVHIRYTNFELSSLELAAVQARREKFTLVDFQTLAEILRTIGRKLEKLDAKLTSISTTEAVVDGTRFKIEYEGRDGRHRSKEMVTSNIADLAMHMYKERRQLRETSQKRSSAR